MRTWRLPIVLVSITALALAVSSVGAGSGGDVLVNNRLLDPPGATQNETTLALHGSTVCAGYNDFVDAGPTGFSRSPDLGATWADRGSPGSRGSDPVLAAHAASGTFYLAAIDFIDDLSAIGVSRSTDDCESFAASVSASPESSAPGAVEDKPWIAVDNSGGERDGNVYVCWDHFPLLYSPDADIRFSRSTDGGLTFVDERVISPPSDVFPFGCYVSVGSEGEVYVTWSNGSYFTTDFSVRFLRSLDGGVTWQAPVRVSSGPVRAPGIDRFRACPPLIRPTLNGDIRMLHQTWMTVDTTGGPANGRIYVVWAHDPPGPIDNSDVFFSVSSDGGVSWSPQQQLGGGSETDQFEPFVAVGGDGAVAVAWYDRRDDPAANYNIKLYTAFSTDGGASFGPLTPVSDVSFPPITSGCYMGEYIAVAADAASFYYAWGDNRNGNPDVFSDSLPVPALGVVATPTPKPPRPRGDTNCDGVVNAIDAALVLQQTAGLLSLLPCSQGADVNADGQTNSVDAALILQISAGLLP